NGTEGVLVRSNDGTVASNLIFDNGSLGDFDGVEVAFLNGFGRGNRIVSNVIIGNAGLGIDLEGGNEDVHDVTANDTGDPDTGPNNLQNFPVLTSAVRSSATGITTVTGSLNGTPSHEFTIQLFLADGDSSHHGRGVQLVGGRTTTTNSEGDRASAIHT